MKLPRLHRDDPPADVTLLLEGTFPMVRGGVSSWVAQLIEGLPDLRFAAVFMGASEADYEGIRYELPRNLVHLEIHYLMEHSGFGSAPIASRGNAAAFATSDALHDYFKNPASGCPGERLAATAALLERPGGLTERDFLHSEASWRQITDYYDRYCADPFIDYFWSVRNMHAPLFRIARIARSLPRSRCLHAISTGYAGFLGALAQSLYDWPLVVTEHGIYTKERQIDLVEADWIHTPEDPLTESPHQPRHLGSGDRAPARLADLRSADLSGVPVDRARHGRVPDAHGDGFRRRYDAYYDAIRDGGTLARIQSELEHMVEAVRNGIYDIFKIQGITVVALILVGPR